MSNTKKHFLILQVTTTLNKCDTGFPQYLW